MTDRSSRTYLFGSTALVSLVPLSALAVGSLHRQVLAVVACVAVTAAVALWWNEQVFRLRAAAWLLLLAATGLTLWTAVQSIPLPRGIIEVVAPHSADVWARCLSPLHQDGPWLATLSLDPAATRVQVVRGLCYIAVFLAALRTAERRHGVILLERVLVASSLVVAAVALIHPALGAHKVLGIYEPRSTLAYEPQHIGPLLNVNHFAAYTNIGLLVAFGALVTPREALPRPVALVVTGLLAATTAWTGSRGGVATAIIGLIVVTIMSLKTRAMRRSQVVGMVVVAVCAIAGVGMVLVVGVDSVRLKFAQNDLSKLELGLNAVQLLTRYGLFGIGRGAFESVFPEVRTSLDYWVFTHPENILVQWTTEWGVPVSIAAGATILWALRPRTVLARANPPVGAWVAIVMLGLHNLVDFNSEVPAVMIALSVCAGVICAGTPEPKGKIQRRLPSPSRVLPVLAGLTAIMSLVVSLPVGRELYEDATDLRKAALDPDMSADDFDGVAKTMMLRHPAEAYLPFTGAVRATANHTTPIAWVGRTLDRSPVYGRAHLMLARFLYGTRSAQARLEYRLACAQDQALCGIREILPTVQSYDDALELIPDNSRAKLVLSSLSDGLAARLPASVTRLDDRLATIDPQAKGPLRRIALAAHDDLMNHESWCGDSTSNECLATGIAAARRLELLEPEKCEGFALEAQVLLASGDAIGAYDELYASLDRVEDRSACSRELLVVAGKISDTRRLEEVADKLARQSCEGKECLENLMLAASIFSQRGSDRRAFALWRTAAQRAPDRDDILIEVAGRAEKLGLHAEAADTYRQLAERHPDDATWRKAADRERSAVTRSLLEQPSLTP